MSDAKQKGDDFPGSHVVGDRVGDKRVDAAQVYPFFISPSLPPSLLQHTISLHHRSPSLPLPSPSHSMIQEQKTPDYNTAQPTNEKLKEKAEENLSERNRKEPTNFEVFTPLLLFFTSLLFLFLLTFKYLYHLQVKDGYATASVNPLDKGDDHTLKSK